MLGKEIAMVSPDLFCLGLRIASAVEVVVPRHSWGEPSRVLDGHEDPLVEDVRV